jgi:hypothetical protein
MDFTTESTADEKKVAEIEGKSPRYAKDTKDRAPSRVFGRSSHRKESTKKAT